MMRDIGVNIIVVLSFEVDLLPLLSSAEDAGLLADNFVWIFIEGSGSAADLGTNPEATRLMAGMCAQLPPLSFTPPPHFTPRARLLAAPLRANSLLAARLPAKAARPETRLRHPRHVAQALL